MSLETVAGKEYVEIRVFLYKYTPAFSLQAQQKELVTVPIYNSATGSGQSNTQYLSGLQQYLGGTSGKIYTYQKICQSILQDPTVIKVQSSANGSFILPADASHIQSLLSQYQSIQFGQSFSPYIQEGAGLGYAQFTKVYTDIHGAPPPSAPTSGPTSPTLFQTTQMKTLIAADLSGSGATVQSSDLFLPTEVTLDFGLGPQPISTLLQQDLTRLQNSGAIQTWVTFVQSISDQITKVLNRFTSLTNTIAAATSSVLEKQYSVIKYNIVLDPSAYFSKFDISKFVSSYTFHQSLGQGTYDWTLNCQDAVIPFAQLTPNIGSQGSGGNLRKIPQLNINSNAHINLVGPSVNPGGGNQDLTYLMAQYDAESGYNDALTTETSEIQQAMLARGKSSATTSQVNADGLRLSDLVQKYNFISVFVYKGLVPFSTIKKTLVGTMIPTSTGSSVPFNESNEVHLMMAGFRNEFNGFALTKSTAKRPGSVDSLTITGQGIMRLLADTRSVFNESLLNSALYDQEELVTIGASVAGVTVSPAINLTTNIFQNLNVTQIVIKLLSLVYRLAISEATPNASFYDLFTFIQNQEGLHNLFVIPCYLLALVMSLRNYNFTYDTLIPTAYKELSGFNADQFGEDYGGPPVQITATTANYQGFFKNLRTSLSDFNSEHKTPFEVLNELRKTTFLEIFERPNGRIVCRSPQYNTISKPFSTGIDPTGNLVQSTNLDVIESSYSESGLDLQVREKGGWVVDYVGNITNNLLQPSYSNGKLTIQYGLRETNVLPNPTLSAWTFQTSAQQSAANVDPTVYVQQYLRFYLEWHNGQQKQGLVKLNGDSSLEVGKLFYDAQNSKIGYIMEVGKQLSIGGTYTATVKLSFVRDTTNPTQSQFRFLPTLEDLVQATTSNPVKYVPVISPTEFNGIGIFLQSFLLQHPS